MLYLLKPARIVTTTRKEVQKPEHMQKFIDFLDSLFDYLKIDPAIKVELVNLRYYGTGNRAEFEGKLFPLLNQYFVTKDLSESVLFAIDKDTKQKARELINLFPEISNISVLLLSNYIKSRMNSQAEA